MATTKAGWHDDALGGNVTTTNGGRWTPEAAHAWHRDQPWLVGCNFMPSTAINQLEMWQAGTFDIDRIDRELALAASLGMNAVRVYLHDLLWAQDAAGFGLRSYREDR